MQLDCLRLVEQGQRGVEDHHFEDQHHGWDRHQESECAMDDMAEAMIEG